MFLKQLLTIRGGPYITYCVLAMAPNAIAEHFHTTRQAMSKHLRILTECQPDLINFAKYYQLKKTTKNEC
jgi:hypothetical protein